MKIGLNAPAKNKEIKKKMTQVKPAQSMQSEPGPKLFAAWSSFCVSKRPRKVSATLF